MNTHMAHCTRKASHANVKSEHVLNPHKMLPASHTPRPSFRVTSFWRSLSAPYLSKSFTILYSLTRAASIRLVRPSYMKWDSCENAVYGLHKHVDCSLDLNRIRIFFASIRTLNNITHNMQYSNQVYSGTLI